MKGPILTTLVLLVALLALILGKAAFYTVPETEQAIITEFGRPIGQPVTAAGLHGKTPFVQSVNYLPKRVMEWDGNPEQIPTKDKLFISVDTYARWRISDPLLFFQRLRDERSAQSRLDDILDGELRNAVAKHELIEIIRTDKDRRPVVDETLAAAGAASANWQPITLGREKIQNEIFNKARASLTSMGIELLDIRFKRINYNNEVQKKIYDRMISERQQIAEKFRSEGQGEALRIRGEKERELRRIESEAYRKIQEIRGKADATATEIYTKAYNQSPEAYSFYQFMKTMETYQTVLDRNTTLILSTTGDLFRFLKSSEQPPAAPSAPPAPKP